MVTDLINLIREYNLKINTCVDNYQKKCNIMLEKGSCPKEELRNHVITFFSDAMKITSDVNKLLIDNTKFFLRNTSFSRILTVDELLKEIMDKRIEWYNDQLVRYIRIIKKSKYLRHIITTNNTALANDIAEFSNALANTYIYNILLIKIINCCKLYILLNAKRQIIFV